MPVAVSLRFDDDLAQLLRERAEIERSSINRLVNDGMRDYLRRKASASASPRGNEEEVRNILARLPEHFALLEKAVKPLDHQESLKDYGEKTREAFQEVKTILTLIVAAMDP